VPVSQARPTPGEIRDRAHEILSRAEFGRSESVPERVANWIGDLFSNFTFGLGGGSGFVGNLLALALIIGVGYVLVRLARELSGRTRKPKVDDDALTIELDAGRHASDWGAEAERFEAEGQWREAMRARYRQLVRSLIDDGVLDDVPGRTTGEYRREFAVARPSSADTFGALTDLFEAVWYGGRATDASDNQQFRALAERSRTREPATA
jgi:hypothetical protein